MLNALEIARSANELSPQAEAKLLTAIGAEGWQVTKTPASKAPPTAEQAEAAALLKKQHEERIALQEQKENEAVKLIVDSLAVLDEPTRDNCINVIASNLTVRPTATQAPSAVTPATDAEKKAAAEAEKKAAADKQAAADDKAADESKAKAKK